MGIRKILPRLVALLALLGPSGCTVHHTPEDFELKYEVWPTFETEGPVAVTTGDAPSGRRDIELAGQTMTLDQREYTQAVADRVEQALEAQGVVIRSDASKRLELEVVYANILPGAGPSHCLIDVTVRAGNGYVRGLQVRDKSYDPEKACNAALSRAALACLSDQKILAYLSSS